MGRSLGTLTLDLVARIGGFTAGMTEAERVADRKSREIERKLKQRARDVEVAWGNITKVVTASIAGISVGAAFAKIINETKQAEREQALLAAALRATGNSAGYSQGRLNEMAEAMAAVTAKSTGEFSQAQTVLLGFTNIVGEQLPKALQAAADFSTRTGSDMKSAAETIGRALDIPSAGMASLQRQGFKFSQSQIEVARRLEETGRIAEAQQIVLDALNETYGGAAEAARDTFGGALDGLRNTIHSLLTGESGSLDGAKNAINDLTNTLSSRETKAAFESIIGWVIELTNTVVKATANIVAFMNTTNKLAVLTGTDTYGKLNAGIRDTADDVKRLTDEVARYQQALARNPNNDNLRRSLANANADLRDAQRAALNASDALKRWAATEGAKVDVKVNPIVAPDLAARAVGAVNLKDGSSATRRTGKSQAEKDAEAAARYLQTLREQADQVKQMTHLERVLYDMRSGKAKFLTAAQKDEAQRLAIIADFNEDGGKMLERQNDLREEAKRLIEEMLSPLQKLAKEEAHINELMTGGYIDAGTAALAIQRARAAAFGAGNDAVAWITGDVSPLSGGMFDQQSARYDAEAKREEERYAAQLVRLQQALADQAIVQQDAWAMQEQFAQQHADRMAQIEQAKSDLMLNTMAGGFGQMAEDMSAFAKQFGVENQGMLAAMKAAAIAQTIIQTYQSAQAAYTAMASIPYVGPALGVAAAAAAIMGGMARVSAIRSQSFAEGGYTGAGGKYEPAGIVHAGEGVLNQADMAALGGPAAFESFRRMLHLPGYADGGVVGTSVPPAVRHDYGRDRAVGTTVNVIEDATRAGQTEQTVGERGDEIINVWVDSIRRNDRAAQVLESTWNLTRRGR